MAQSQNEPVRGPDSKSNDPYLKIWVRNADTISKMRVGQICQTFIMVVFFLSSSHVLGSTGITYHGRILRPNGEPVTSRDVQFRIQIRSPGSESCVLWEEYQTKDLSTTAGIFSITINDASEPSLIANSLPFSFGRIFSNRETFSNLSACSAGNSYNPNSIDGRALQVFFREDPDDPWERMPMTRVNFVPLALNAMQVEGYSSNEFLKVDGSSTYAPLSPGQVSTLMDILTGSASSPYIAKTENFGGDLQGSKGGAQASVVGLQGRPVSSTAPMAGQLLQFINGAWTPSSASDSAKLSLSGGTMTGVLDMGGQNLLNASAVTSNIFSGRSYVLSDNDLNTATIKAPDNIASNYTLTLPASGPVDGSVLSTDSSGNLAWITTPSEISGLSSGFLTKSTSASTIGNSLIYESGGNIGIGTTSPVDKLSVGGVITSSSGSGNISLTPDHLGRGYIQSYQSIGVFRPMEIQGQGLTFSAKGSNFSFVEGNIGIGTTSPEVGWPQMVPGAAGSVFTTVAGGNSQIPAFQVWRDTDSLWGGYFNFLKSRSGAPAQINDEIGYLNFGFLNSGSKYSGAASITSKVVANTDGAETGSLVFRTRTGGSTSDAMTIVGGNVGVGTATPAYKLDVAGPVNATQLMINGTDVSSSAGSWTVAGSDVYRATGNVGIGTTTPSSKLDVAGALTVNNSVRGLSGGAAPNQGLWLFGNSNASDGGYIGLRGPNADDGAGDDRRGTVDIGAYSAGGRPGSVRFLDYNGTGWDYNMVIQPDGKVGIGTTTPGNTLEVRAPFDLKQVNSYPNGQNTQTFGVFGSESNPFGVYLGLIGSPTEANRTALLQTTNTGLNNNGNLALQPNGGNVGIGTTVPAYKLDVAGPINATQLLINGTDISSSAGAWTVAGGNVHRNAGRVGIGTTNPLYTLDIVGPYAGAGLNPHVHIGFNPGNGLFLAGKGDNTHYNWLVGQQDLVQGLSFTPSTAPGNTTFTTPALVLKENGNVGIGTISPGYKLDVAGPVNATQLLINGNDVSAGAGAWTVSGGNVYRNAGNVGIGTSSPNSKFEILANNPLPTTAANNDPASFYNRNHFKMTSNNNGLYFGVDDIGNSRTSYIQSGHAEPSWTSATSDAELLIQPFGGNVGIGTTNPSDLLHVFRSGQGSTGITTTSDAGSGISLAANRGSGGNNPLTQAGDASMIFSAGAINTGSLVIGQWSTSARGMRIDPSGNVGVGTTAPEAKLDVQGQIRPSMGTPLVNPPGNAVDFVTGNTQYVTFSTCPGNTLTVNLYSMLEGGSYSLVVESPNGCLVTFTGVSHRNGESGGTAVTAFRYPASQNFSSTGYPMVYSFLRANNRVFVAQVIDFQ